MPQATERRASALQSANFCGRRVIGISLIPPDRLWVTLVFRVSNGAFV